MQIIKFIIEFILHIDVHLGQIISAYGILTYVLLFIIIFIETGLVVTPFLPGDSLLFAVGAFAALGSLNIFVLLIILMAAAVLGDTANYWIGHFFGEKLVANPKVPIKKEHIEKTKRFFDKHGGKTIILARFIPIIRTFAPFVAGIGKMHYGQFLSFNVIGGITWVLLVTLAGFFFGNIPMVKNNFSTVIIAIVLISIAPMIIQAIIPKFQKEKTS
ncbi:MAG: DedA family protein [Candidatus Shapirobacteria bacterium]|nr:DedA family protein [Candidatus Shapirobacteria bacterium]